MTGVREPLYNLTQFQYDLNGNRVKTIAAYNLVTTSKYDELNRVYEQVDSLTHSTTFSYDANGNRNKMVDRRGSTWVYQYLDNNLLHQLDVTNGELSYQVVYTYDAAGNRVSVVDSGNEIHYNLDANDDYVADPLNRINNVKRTFDGVSYTTKYQYKPAGQLAQILYPEASSWLVYNYDSQNRLSEVVGFTASENGIQYNKDGSLTSVTYANGTVTNYTYDSNQRLSNLKVTPAVTGPDILNLVYAYDNANNITKITDGGKDKLYTYDANSQLIQAVTPGQFAVPVKTPDTYGQTELDYQGASRMDLTQNPTGSKKLDYNASSVGIDFGGVTAGIKQIRLVPNSTHQTHRIADKNTIDLFTSTNNSLYSLIPRTNWTFAKDGTTGVITISFTSAISTRYLKVHVKFDDRDSDYNSVDNAQFLNGLAQMLQVYQEASSQTEEYQYDAAGNRTLLRVTLLETTNYSSYYYSNSDRLKTDGKYAFDYDAAGNMVMKGNTFVISGDTVTFTTTGEGVEYWEYEYDLLNRLIQVTKNGSIVSKYSYDPEGLRVVKRKYTGESLSEKTHYVFEGTEPIFEKRITENTSNIQSYVFAFGKHLARVDGVIGGTNAPKYYYHTDHVGSVRAVSNQAGQVVWSADYLAFGSKCGENVDSTFTPDDLGFTGKGYDADTGLYYFNARWYDSELGRFISEDPAMDPNNPNLYSYCANNPLSNIDPTGLDSTYTGNEDDYSWMSRENVPYTGNTDDYSWMGDSGVTVTNNPDGSTTISSPPTSINYGGVQYGTTITIYGPNATRLVETYISAYGEVIRVTTETVGNAVEKKIENISRNGSVLASQTMNYDVSQGNLYFNVENPGGGRLKDKSQAQDKNLFTLVGMDKNYQLDYRAAVALLDMIRAAQVDGITSLVDRNLGLNDGFRSDKRQRELWDERVNKLRATIEWGTKYFVDREAFNREVNRGVGYPGKGPHRTGRAIDFNIEGMINDLNNTPNQTQTDTYKWLAQHANNYGYYVYTTDGTPGGSVVESWHWEYNPKALSTDWSYSP